MSVLIKGMKMPSCCDDCWALDDFGEYPVCRITGEQRGYNFRTREKRMNACPLVPVPPHGRLIDADALKIMMPTIGDEYLYAREMIEEAPTIIEAEEEQE